MVTVETQAVGDLVSAHVEYSVDGEAQPDVPMSDEGNGRFSAALGSFEEPGTFVEYRVRVEDTNATVMRSFSRGFEVVDRLVKAHDVLLVVDDRDRGQVQHISPYYRRALDEARVGHDFWDTSELGPPLEDDLLPYVHGAVVWAVPDYNPWLWHHPERDRVPDAIATFLDAGGSLFISGQHIAEHYRHENPDWLANYLHAEHANCCSSGQVESVPGRFFGGGIATSLHGGDGANQSHSPDAIKPVGGAVSILRYEFGDFVSGPEADTADPDAHDSLSIVAGIAARDGQSRVVFFAFSFESIFSSTTRAEVMATVIGWMNPTCNGRASTIDGSHGPDTLRGTPGPDVIVGLGGNDQIYGLAGNDVICGGGGRDILVGGPGADWIAGETGNDTLVGGSGGDSLNGGPGNDVLKGAGGPDVLTGGPGKDRFKCGKGSDLADGGPRKRHRQQELRGASRHPLTLWAAQYRVVDTRERCQDR